MNQSHYLRLLNIANAMKTYHVIQGYKRGINLSGNPLLRKLHNDNLRAYINKQYPDFFVLINIYKP